MIRRIGLAKGTALVVGGLALIGGCTTTGTSQDLFTLATGGLQNLLTFVIDFAQQLVTAFLL